MARVRKQRSGASSQAGIRVNGCFILGLDGQGPEIFDRVLEFAMENRAVRRPDHSPDAVPRNAFVLALKIRVACSARGLGDVYTLDINFRPEQMTPRNCERFHRPHSTLQHELTSRRRANFDEL